MALRSPPNPFANKAAFLLNQLSPKAKLSALFCSEHRIFSHKINFRGDCGKRDEITSLLFLLSGTEKRKRSFPLFCRHRKGVGLGATPLTKTVHHRLSVALRSPHLRTVNTKKRGSRGETPNKDCSSLINRWLCGRPRTPSSCQQK